MSGHAEKLKHIISFFKMEAKADSTSPILKTIKNTTSKIAPLPKKNIVPKLHTTESKTVHGINLKMHENDEGYTKF